MALGGLGTRNRLIVLATDAGFVMPTMSLVLQILAQPRVLEIADVNVYLVGLPTSARVALDEAFADLSVKFVDVPTELLALPAHVRFNKTHVPTTALARLSLGELIAPQYEHLLYLDGDIQLLGDIVPLVEHDVAPGKIAAGNDALWLYEGDYGHYWKMISGYITGLGLQSPGEYFNSGVLAFRRTTWLSEGIAARDFFFRNSELCLYHDQSALNAIFREKREVLSPIYNYVSGYADLDLAEQLQPRIVHFTGGAKPWNSRCRPWYGRFIPHYETILNSYPVLKSFNSEKTSTELSSIDRDVERRWRIMMLRTPWRPALRRRKLRRYIVRTQFAV